MVDKGEQGGREIERGGEGGGGKEENGQGWMLARTGVGNKGRGS